MRMNVKKIAKDLMDTNRPMYDALIGDDAKAVNELSTEINSGALDDESMDYHRDEVMGLISSMERKVYNVLSSELQKREVLAVYIVIQYLD